MPYISQTIRPKYDKHIKELGEKLQQANSLTMMGEFNYLLSGIINEILSNKYHHNYRGMNEIIGMLECCKLELYRRLIASYENKKCALNGDVFDADIRAHDVSNE